MDEIRNWKVPPQKKGCYLLQSALTKYGVNI
jgi:hypothetical protein